MVTLLWMEAGLFVVVLIGYPVFAWAVRKGESPVAPRALYLPNGSVRAMLALLSVGSFLIVLVVGGGVRELHQNFDQIVTAFGTLTGSIIGFYFGARVAQPPPS